MTPRRTTRAAAAAARAAPVLLLLPLLLLLTTARAFVFPSPSSSSTAAARTSTHPPTHPTTTLLFAARKKKGGGGAGEGFGSTQKKKEEPVAAAAAAKEEEEDKEEEGGEVDVGEFKSKMEEVGKSLQALAKQVDARAGDGEVRFMTWYGWVEWDGRHASMIILGRGALSTTGLNWAYSPTHPPTHSPTPPHLPPLQDEYDPAFLAEQKRLRAAIDFERPYARERPRNWDYITGLPVPKRIRVEAMIPIPSPAVREEYRELRPNDPAYMAQRIKVWWDGWVGRWVGG